MSMEYDNESRGGYEADNRDNYDRDRSNSPRPRSPNGNTRMRSRSASPGGRGDSGGRAAPSDTADRRDRDASPGNGKEEGARNTGTNLFVTGIHPKLTEDDVAKIFSKYGEVVKCNIMLDPHTRESRGFGFVNFAASDQADAAKDGLQNETFEGRTLSIEKARRNRPRTPTPGKYFGPPKRDDFRRSRPAPYRSSYRGGDSGYAGRYSDRGDDDRYYRSRYDDRDRERGGGGDRDRDRYYSRREYAGGRDDYDRGADRYAREERYDGRDDRRVGGGGSFGGYYEDARPRGAGYYDDQSRGVGGYSDRDGHPAYDTRSRETAGAAPDDRMPTDAPARERGGGYYADRGDRGERGDREDRYRR